MSNVVTSDTKIVKLQKELENLREEMNKKIRDIEAQRDLDALTEIAKLRQKEAEILSKAHKEIEKVKKKYQPQIEALEEEKRKRMDELFNRAFSKIL